MKSIRRWVYIINTIRALPYNNFDDETMEIEVNRLTFESTDDGKLKVFNAETKELEIIFTEDGHPEYLSEWANEPMNWEPYDYKMYETSEIDKLETIAWSISPGQKVLIYHRGKDYVIDTKGDYILVFDNVDKLIMKLGYNEKYIY